MSQELEPDRQAAVFPRSDRFAGMEGIPGNDDGDEQGQPDYAMVLTLARQVEAVRALRALHLCMGEAIRKGSVYRTLNRHLSP